MGTMRLRIKFEKSDEMRFTGHLDLHRTWERTFRRAKLPLAYSQGFHPQPKINLASALPLGFTSTGEVADIWLEDELPLGEIRSQLENALPPGIKLKEIEQVEDQEPALQTLVVASEYEIILMGPNNQLDRRIDELLSKDNLPRERRGKLYDLRPLVEELYHLPDDDQCRPRLFLRMSTRPGATGRPEELLSALDISPASALVHRTCIIFEIPSPPPTVAASPTPPTARK
jgi:radical SAM-linked protein